MYTSVVYCSLADNKLCVNESMLNYCKLFHIYINYLVCIATRRTNQVGYHVIDNAWSLGFIVNNHLLQGHSPRTRVVIVPD